jgi:ABC-type sugar transport system substrate-binding protein
MTISVVGCDAGPDEIAAILDGTELASVAQFPFKMGELGADTAFRAANGETVPELVDTGTEIVTKDNAADFQ